MQYLNEPLANLDGLLNVDEIIDVSAVSTDPVGGAINCCSNNYQCSCNTVQGCACRPQ